MSALATKTPLAWLNLTHDRRRLVTSMAGVGFAVVLIFTELGFFNALLDSFVAPIQRLDDDPHPLLVMIHRDKDTLVDPRRFSRRWLVEAEANPDVDWARPVFIEANDSDWHDPQTDESRKIRVLASDSPEVLSILAGSVELATRLRSVGTGLLDVRSKPAFGVERFLAGTIAAKEPETVLARHPLRIVGTFDLGTDFANDGNVIVSMRTFDLLFPIRQVFKVDVPAADLGVIRLKDGTDERAVRDRLTKELKAEVIGVRILTPAEMIEREQSFWQEHTPVGPIFKLGVFLGFVVGVVICYQVLSSDIRDHLAEYATLKAIGYPNPYLVKVVCGQALWLGLLGFGPGVVVTHYLYSWLRTVTGLPMQLTLERLGWVLLLTLTMCLCSAYLAIRKLFKADPAELFR